MFNGVKTNLTKMSIAGVSCKEIAGTKLTEKEIIGAFNRNGLKRVFLDAKKVDYYIRSDNFLFMRVDTMLVFCERIESFCPRTHVYITNPRYVDYFKPIAVYSTMEGQWLPNTPMGRNSLAHLLSNHIGGTYPLDKYRSYTKDGLLTESSINHAFKHECLFAYPYFKENTDFTIKVEYVCGFRQG